MPRTTLASLRTTIARLRPFEEFFYCRGHAPVILVEANGDQITLIGQSRPSGGLVIDGPSLCFAEHWAHCASKGDPYQQSLARKVTAEIKKAYTQTN